MSKDRYRVVLTKTRWGWRWLIEHYAMGHWFDASLWRSRKRGWWWTRAGALKAAQRSIRKHEDAQAAYENRHQEIEEL